MTTTTTTFPLLENDEILLCMQEMGIPMTLDELTKPNGEQFVHNLMGASLDLNAPTFQELNALNTSYPELHEEALTELHFSRSLMTLMRTCAAYDFSMRDVFKPTGPRTKRFLSAIINFVKFREQCMGMYQELHNKMQSLTDERQRLDDRNAELSKHYQRIIKVEEEEQPAVDKLHTEIEALLATLNSNDDKQKEMRKDIEAIKDDIESTRRKTKDDKVQLTTILQEVEVLKKQLVDSPDKVERQIEELRVKADRLKSSLNDLTSRSTARGTTYAAYVTRDRDLKALSKVLDSCIKDVDRLMAAGKETEERSSRLKEAESSLQDIENSLEMLNRQQKNAVQKQQKAKQQMDQKIAGQQETLLTARSDFSTMDKRRKAMQLESDAKSHELNIVQSKIKDEECRHEDDMARLRMQFEETKAQVRAYHQSLRQEMK